MEGAQSAGAQSAGAQSAGARPLYPPPPWLAKGGRRVESGSPILSKKSSPTASAHAACALHNGPSRTIPDHPGAPGRTRVRQRRALPGPKMLKNRRFFAFFASWPVLGRSGPRPWPSWVLLGALPGLLGPLLAVLGQFFASWAAGGRFSRKSPFFSTGGVGF